MNDCTVCDVNHDMDEDGNSCVRRPSYATGNTAEGYENTGEGGTLILVGNTTFVGEMSDLAGVEITKAITIECAEETGTCIWDGENSRRVVMVRVFSGGVNLLGLTITRGSTGGGGGGAYIEGDVTMTNVGILENDAGGVSILSHSLDENWS